jgi:hypothetical protein
MTVGTKMKRPRDNSKTLAQRPDRQSKGVTREAFLDLTQALGDALAFELGECRDLWVTRIQGFRPPKSVNSRHALRQELNRSKE